MIPDVEMGMSSHRRWKAAPLRCALVAAAFCYAPTIARGQGGGPTQVQVAEVRVVDVGPTISLVGTVRPRLRTTVASEVSGLLAELPIDDGDRVEKGQTLARLRSVPRKLALKQATARLHELEQTLAERQAELDKAEFEAHRLAGLWEERRCTEKEYRDAGADHRAALGRVKQAEHAVGAQQAAVDLLKDELERSEIRAPCAGVIVRRMSEIGSWVEQGGAIAELIDLSVARVRVDVPEDSVAFCGVGDDAPVTVQALKRTFSGKIGRVIPDADQQARTFPVDIDVINEDGALKSGMFVHAAVPSGPSGPRSVVPKDAVVIRGSRRLAFVVRTAENGAMATPVGVTIVSELAGPLADHVAVDAPELSPGDEVVIRGNEYMFGPTPVVVLRPAAPPSEAQAQPTNRPGA